MYTLVLHLARVLRSIDGSPTGLTATLREMNLSANRDIVSSLRAAYTWPNEPWPSRRSSVKLESETGAACRPSRRVLHHASGLRLMGKSHG